VDTVDPAAELRRMLARPEQELDLARACLLIARQEYPDVQADLYLDRLQTLGEGATRLVRNRVADDAAHALALYLAEEEGFTGNREDYYDPRNSFLNQVLDRRTGVPITLSAVYMEVGRRAGLHMEGVGLPGHFVVRVLGTGEGSLLDPFFGGTLLTAEDCQHRLDRIYGGKVQLTDDMLRPCGPRGMLARMLRNLKSIYVQAGDHERALRTVDLLVTVDRDSTTEVRDRGLLYAAMDCYGLAAQDLLDYVDRSPQAADAAELRQRAQDLRARASRLN
jgi:regulator of sirC expression with transglutaminase-like and TPR domain